MKHYFIYNSKEQDSEKLLKTPRRERGSIKYKIYHKDCIEVIELFPGEDDVTEIDVKNFYSAEDSEVYYNLKARKPQLEDWQKELIEKYKADYIRDFEAANHYAPSSDDVDAAVAEAFPKNWLASLDELTSSMDEEDGLDDKSSVLANAWYADHPKKSRSEERLEELRATWSESWQEIYDRVLIGGESIVSIARERGVNESAVRKTTNKIRKAIASDPILQKLMR